MQELWCVAALGITRHQDRQFAVFVLLAFTPSLDHRLHLAMLAPRERMLQQDRQFAVFVLRALTPSLDHRLARLAVLACVCCSRHQANLPSQCLLE